MNYITTNIRFPEEDYMMLKMEAAKRRISFAALVRERTIKKRGVIKTGNTEKLIQEMSAFAKKMAKKYPRMDSTKALREMRYEQ